MITIEDLIEYRKTKARILSLSVYNVGSGIMLSRLNEDDQLQELHKRLRGLPSYMYLSEHEQDLELTAKANLEHHPAGIQSQIKAIPKQGADRQETKELRETRKKLEKVAAARIGEREDIDGVLDRLTEFQDKQALIKRLDSILEALELYKPEYAHILRLRYVEGKETGAVAYEIGYTEATIRRKHAKAVTEFEKLAN